MTGMPAIPDHDLAGRVQQMEGQHVAYMTAIKEMREHYDDLLQGVLTAIRQPPAAVQEWVPLKALVGISAGVIALLVSGVLTLTSSWSTTQSVRIGTLEVQARDMLVTMERAKTEKERLSKSLDEDHAHLVGLLSSSGRTDEIIKKILETMHDFKSVVETVAAQQVGIRRSVDRIEDGMGHATPAVPTKAR